MDKILIIDSQKNAELMRKTLENYMYQIFIATDAEDAFTKLKIFSPDLIIVDSNLSDMSGYEFCKKIKEMDGAENIIILILSSLNNKQEELKAFGAGADDFMEKNFDAMVLIKRVKYLLRIKYLGTKLKKKYDELEEKNNILAQQLEMAQKVQKSFIPEIDIKLEKIIFYSRYLPAMYIGGDFYDVIKLSENNFCVILGDVSGHGISAALLTAMLNIMIRNMIENFDAELLRPDKILKELNKQFILNVNTNEVYACVFVMLIDLKERKIFYANAGQPMPILIFNDEKRNKFAREAKELFAAGTPIGLMPDSEYEFKEMNYKSGDKIFFYTDGLENNLYKDDNQRFCFELKKIICDTVETSFINEEKSCANEICDNVINKFCNRKQNNNYDDDDVSMIVCELN